MSAWDEWFASLKVGDEVGLHRQVGRVTRRTSKFIWVNDKKFRVDSSVVRNLRSGADERRDHGLTGSAGTRSGSRGPS